MPSTQETLPETPRRAGAPSHSVGSRLIQNSAANFLGQAVIVGLTLLCTPYITRKLGPSGYGALNLLMAYLFSFSLLNLGLNASLVKFLAELLPQNRAGEIQEYFSTSFTFLVAVGLLAGAAVWMLASPIVERCFKGDAGLTSSAVTALRVASVAFVLQFVCQALSAVPAAAQRFEILSLIGYGSNGLRILGTVILLWLGRGLPSLMAMVVFAVGASALGYAIADKRLLPYLRLSPGWSQPRFHSLVGHSKFVVVVNASNQLVSTADSFLLGFFLPVANIAYYGVAYALAQRLWASVANVVGVVFPAASAFSGAADRARFNELYLRGMKVAAISAVFPSFALCIFGRDFLLFWLGPDYAERGAPVLILVTLGFLLNSFSYVAYQVLQSTHRVNFAARASVIYSLLNLAAFAVFIPRFGTIGAAGAFLGSQVVFVPWFLHRTNRLLGVRWVDLFVDSYARVFAAAGLGSAVCWVCSGWVHSFLTLVLAGSLGLAVYVGTGLALVLDSRDRAASRILLQRWAGAIRAAV
jgi:O-antigen/teichoic acid export membrane protein